LFAEQHQQLRLCREHLTQSILKSSASFDALADVVDPLFGNAFDPPFSGGHEGQETNGVTLTGSTVAGGFAAAAMGDGKGAGQEILGQGELAQQSELALAPASGLGTFWGDIHLNVIMHSEMMKINSFL
jgi:hypothetical protein